MKRLREPLAGPWVLIAVCVTLAGTPAFSKPAHKRASPACCRAPAGTIVNVELVKDVSTVIQKSGETFDLRLAAPLVVNGRILLRAGTPGVGDVVESSRAGLGGKPAKLVLAARYLTAGSVRVPLRGLQLGGGGRSKSGEAAAVGLGGLVFAPLGFVGLAVKGGQVTFPAGTKATASLAADVTLPSLGRAPKSADSALETQTASDVSQTIVAGSISIPPPPPGEGQVVFFRRKSTLGTAQWFKVRENGKALTKLTNGAYFVQITDPGVHTYTATFEPELKDHLKLEVDPGETYFVEGALSKGFLLSAADLSPSDRATFEKAAKSLKPAPSIADDKGADKADDEGADKSGVKPNEGDTPAPSASQAPAASPSQSPR